MLRAVKGLTGMLMWIVEVAIRSPTKDELSQHAQ